MHVASAQNWHVMPPPSFCWPDGPWASEGQPSQVYGCKRGVRNRDQRGDLPQALWVN